MNTSLTTKLDELALGILAGTAGSADPWGGAGVVLRRDPRPQRPASESSFYPDADEVATPHVRELSWLFTELRDVVNELPEYYLWKFEYFGRLAARAASVATDLPAETLLLAVLYEAYEMVGRLEAGLPMPEFEPIVIHPRTLGAGMGEFDPTQMIEFYATRGITVV
jgi:hypothetical protein